MSIHLARGLKALHVHMLSVVCQRPSELVVATVQGWGDACADKLICRSHP